MNETPCIFLTVYFINLHEIIEIYVDTWSKMSTVYENLPKTTELRDFFNVGLGKY